MILGIIGSGGREHSICLKLSNSKKISKIYCFPGNAGTSKIAENVNIDLSDFKKLKNFITNNKIELVIVGPEKPLVNGIVDFLEKHKIKVFGPNKLCSKLEGSKIFTKKICEKYKIPTAKFGIFNSKFKANNFLEKANMPIVVKADGLAAGKGVYICENLESSKNAVDEIFGGKFGIAENVLIEEFLEGNEMSYFVLADGKNFKSFNTAQDHKRVGEGDIGKNTGGMGAYAPSGLNNPELENKIINQIVKPTFKAIREMGESYTGFLYVGLMIKNNEPYLIEFNVRMGDPECQTILPLLKTDLLSLILSCCDKNLKNHEIKWFDKKSLCIVLCSKGYPDKYDKNTIINNFYKLKTDDSNYIFHAGTKESKKEILATGGRVLNFVSISSSFKKSRNNTIKKINELDWKKGFFRKDIGYKIIDQ